MKKQVIKPIQINPSDSSVHVEYYIQENRLFFGIQNKFFSANINATAEYNHKTRGEVCKIIEILGDVVNVSKSKVLSLLTDQNLTCKDAGYTFKRYVWDTEDCVEIETKDIQVSDLLYDEEYNAMFLVTKITDNVAHLMCTSNLVEYEFELPRLSNFQAFRAARLWK